MTRYWCIMIHNSLYISGISIESTKWDYRSILFSLILISNKYVCVIRIFRLAESFLPTKNQIVNNTRSRVMNNFARNGEFPFSYNWNKPLKFHIYFQILLIEAGIEEPEVAEIPGFASTLTGSNIDWMYHTQPQQYGCLAGENRECVTPRGKVCIHIFWYINFLELYTGNWIVVKN